MKNNKIINFFFDIKRKGNMIRRHAKKNNIQLCHIPMSKIKPEELVQIPRSK